MKLSCLFTFSAALFVINYEKVVCFFLNRDPTYDAGELLLGELGVELMQDLLEGGRG